MRNFTRALLAVACVASFACGGPTAQPDGGSPPPAQGDAGADAGADGGFDAGTPDAGAPDAGCAGDAGAAVRAADGGVACAACEGAQACGAGARCAIRAGACGGTCAMFRAPCAAGPAPAVLDVSVLASSFACPGRHEAGCDYHHRVDFDAGTVALAIDLLGSGERAVKVVPLGALAPTLAAQASTAWCFAPADFLPACVGQSTGLRMAARAEDAGLDVTWSMASGVVPFQRLDDALLELLRVGDRVFRDAGTSWSRGPL